MQNLLGIIDIAKDAVKRYSGGVVVYRGVGGLGDAIMILPALTALKRKFPKLPLIVVCVDYVQEIFLRNPVVDFVISFDKLGVERAEDIHLLAEFEYIGCKIYQLYRPCPSSQYEAANEPLISLSRQEIFSRACNVEFDINNYNFILHDDELHARQELFGGERYVVVQLRSHDKSRDYPYIRWLIHELSVVGRRNDFFVVTMDAVKTIKHKYVKSYAGLPIPKVLSIINGAEMVIGQDSSFVHIGGALERPIYGIYGPTNPACRLKYKYAYWNKPYTKCPRQYCWYHPCKFKFCLSRLRPSTIIKTVLNVIGEVENVTEIEEVSI